MELAGVLVEVGLWAATDAPVEVAVADTGGWDWIPIVAASISALSLIATFFVGRASVNAARASVRVATRQTELQAETAEASILESRRATAVAMEQTALQERIAYEARLPQLWGDIRPHPISRDYLFISIGNTGQTSAHNVKMVIEPPLEPAEGWRTQSDSAQTAARVGIATLTPGRTMEYKLGEVGEVVEANLHVGEFRVTLTGETSDGEELRQEYAIRAQDIHKTTVVGGGSMRLIGDQINQLRSEVRNIGNVIARAGHSNQY